MTNDELKKLENKLWDTANSLRAYGGIKASDYAVPVLGLIFLRFADNKYSHAEPEINRIFEQDRGSRLERFEKVIQEYNSGSISIEEAYEQLTREAEDLTEEQGRAAREEMSEEELEIFDLLKREKLTKAEEAKVKSAAQTLLKRLRDARDTVLIREWYKHQQSQEQVRREIQVILHGTLPETYGNDLFDEKTDLIFQHLYCQAEWNQGVGAIAH